jgi:hypothetical protein
MNNPLDSTLRELNDCGCCAGTGKETPVAIDNRPGLDAISFRAGTHPQFKASLLDALSDNTRRALAGLKTREDDDFTVALLDGLATLADVLTFYSERIANESYLRTATERGSVLELARAIGYELNPGVAASTWLAFTVDDAKGTPGFANIDRGTKVQSLPGAGEKPQTYETTQPIFVRKEWNALHPKHTYMPAPHWGQTTLRLQGTSTNLKPGDALLIIGDERRGDPKNENWDFRRVKSLATFPNAETPYTLVTLDRGLGKAVPSVQPARANAKVFALRERLNVFGYNAPDPRTLQFMLAGLLGEYFQDTNLTQRVLTRVDPNVDFNWTGVSPCAGLGTTNYSVRWTGVVKTGAGGNYVFTTSSDDGVRLWVDGRLLIDKWVLQGTQSWSGDIWLEAGKFYDLRLEYFQGPGAAEVHLSWTEPGQASQIIPAERLFRTLSEWPGLTLADISRTVPGADIITLHLEGTHPEVIPGPCGWLVVSTPEYQEVYSVTSVAEDSRSGFTFNAKTTRVGVEGENLRLKFNDRVRAITVFAQSEELPRAVSPLWEPVVGDGIILEREVTDFPPGRLLLVRGAPARVWVTRAGAKLELQLISGGTLPLVEGQLLTLLGEPVLQNEAVGTLGSSLFSPSDFKEISALVGDLRSHSDPLSQYLWKQISGEEQQVLLNPNSTEQQQQSTLAKALNKILQGSSIYEDQRFASVKLSPEVLSLILQYPQGKDLILLNRWLLEDAYPRWIATTRTLRWDLQPNGGQAGFVLATRQQLEFAAADPNSQLIVEQATVKKVEKSSEGLTRLVLFEPLHQAYDPSTVTIFANVASVTHGETVNEIVGGGDATRPHQRFVLKQKPLTYTPAVNPSGGETSLEIWVNNVKWQEVPSLFRRGPGERVYVTRLADDGMVSVIFGDGVSGARLPTGQENIRAVYRKGIGLEGLAKAEQLSLLMTRPLGVKSVLNPRACEGAADPQSFAEARRNAPLTVLTLDRVVSLQDYEDFARGFSGITKALATWTWNVQSRGVFITVAGPAGAALSDDSATRENLLGALGSFQKPGEPVPVKFGNPLVPVQVKSYKPVQFQLKGTVYVAADRVPDQVLAAVQEALKAAFSFDARAFGQAVALSEVESVIQNVPGVVAVDIDELDKVPGHQRRKIVTAAKPAAGAAADQVQPAELLTLDETSLADLVVKTYELRR